MFKTRKELIDFLLTSDFSDEYSILEYKYFLSAYKEVFRNIYSQNERLNQRASQLEAEIKELEKEKINYTLQTKIYIDIINNLKKKVPKKGKLKRFFANFFK